MQSKHRSKKFISVLLFGLLVFFAIPLEQGYAAPTLRVNAKGASVMSLQNKLMDLGYEVDEATGIFEAKTHYAVKQFQRDHQLTANGVVDKKTWKALDLALKNRKQRIAPRVSTPSKEAAKSLPHWTEGSRKNAPAILKTAKQYIGVPYQFGGATPKGFDCSGYLQYVFAKHSIHLPRSADEQYKTGTNVKKSALLAGDLVFFTTYESGASHCGIYIGNGEFIHSSSSKGIRIDKMDDPYWKPRYIGAKCILK